MIGIKAFLQMVSGLLNRHNEKNNMNISGICSERGFLWQKRVRKAAGKGL